MNVSKWAFWMLSKKRNEEDNKKAGRLVKGLLWGLGQDDLDHAVGRGVGSGGQVYIMFWAELQRS